MCIKVHEDFVFGCQSFLTQAVDDIKETFEHHRIKPRDESNISVLGSAIFDLVLTKNVTKSMIQRCRRKTLMLMLFSIVTTDKKSIRLLVSRGNDCVPGKKFE